MKAVSRVKVIWLATAAALAPAAALAQQTAPTSNNQSATDAVGPRELQNFKLPGTVTRPSDQPATNGAPATRTPAAPASDVPVQTAPDTAPTVRRATPTPRPPIARSSRAPSETTTAPQAATPSTALPAPSSSTTVPTFTPEPTPSPSFAPAPATTPADTSQPGPSVPYYVWLIAALILGGGAAFVLRRNRSRLAYAAAEDDSAYAPPVPAPTTDRVASPPASPVTERITPAPIAPAPAPAPAPVASPATSVAAPAVGIVSTRLRPWVDFGFTPLRCTLEDAQAVIDFELELFNGGSAPARGVVVAATAFNAGPQQDTQIANYFDHPTRQGHAIDALMPMERTVVPLQLSIPRDQLQLYELGGHQVFVPIFAANVTYAWGSGEGQSSASFLVGRGTGSDKLSPFRIDAGPRAITGLDAKPLPLAVRR